MESYFPSCKISLLDLVIGFAGAVLLGCIIYAACHRPVRCDCGCAACACPPAQSREHRAVKPEPAPPVPDRKPAVSVQVGG
jgi:hypothetical protein